MNQEDLPKGASPLDPNEMEDLRIKTITTRGELDRWEQQNIGESMDWLDSRKNKSEIFHEDFVKKLHDKMLNKVWAWAGCFRKTDKNIGVDKYRIGVELKILLDDTKYWIDKNTYESDEIAARFHHRLVKIHCFPNGNGRHSRLMTDTLLSDVLEKEPFTWGNGNLSVAGDVREMYINALRSADDNDYEPLMKFVRS
jgi:Fic-DOC domain mobile mystery protein B